MFRRWVQLPWLHQLHGFRSWIQIPLNQQSTYRKNHQISTETPWVCSIKSKYSIIPCMEQWQFWFSSHTHKFSLCSPTRSSSEQLLQSTKTQFTADAKCALTNTGSKKFAIKSVWPCSHLFVFAFEELWSYQVLLAKNIVESEFWNHTEKYLQKVTFWVPPGNICTRCAPRCLQPGLETSPHDQAEFSNSNQILKTPNESPEQTDQKFGVYERNLSGLIKSKAPGNQWEDFLSLQELQVNTIRNGFLKKKTQNLLLDHPWREGEK